MFAEVPQNIVLLAVGAFLLGWVLASISARMGPGFGARKRDPRDDRIRSLEAEYRIAQSNLAALREKFGQLEKELQVANDEIGKRDNVITHQQSRVSQLKHDLSESVRKTRELRIELSERATECIHSEAKQRDLETELSIAQASTDLIATGVLDYSFADETDDSEIANENMAAPPARGKAVT
ncbi:MAG TPA: hypothetical protein PKK10_17915 [Woeseiaceae bacterium]|nr:hypothetical protein [Woeseiaceae bacterium]